jgi:hypothetical protein
MKVLDYNEAAKRGKITRRTLERQIADGVGPATVRLSKRRVGIFESDFEAWLLKRRRPAPGQDAEASPTPEQGRDHEEADRSEREDIPSLRPADSPPLKPRARLPHRRAADSPDATP